MNKYLKLNMEQFIIGFNDMTILQRICYVIFGVFFIFFLTGLVLGNVIMEVYGISFSMLFGLCVILIEIIEFKRGKVNNKID